MPTYLLMKNTHAITKTVAALATSVCLLPGPVAGALSVGSFAFVGFDADVDDSFAIVALEDIPGGEEVFFRDDEWDALAGAFVSTGEGEVKWTTSALPAGTTILFTNTQNDVGALTDPFIVSDGTLQGTDIDAMSGAIDLSGSGETLWAYQGSSNTPGDFIAAVSTDGLAGGVDGTGLTEGSTAVSLPAAIDVAEYEGPISGQAAFPDYLAFIGNPDNWATANGTGDQSEDILPYAAAQGFTVIPEPTPMGLLGLGLAGWFLRRKRGKR